MAPGAAMLSFCNKQRRRCAHARSRAIRASRFRQRLYPRARVTASGTSASISRAPETPPMTRSTPLFASLLLMVGVPCGAQSPASNAPTSSAPAESAAVSSSSLLEIYFCDSRGAVLRDCTRGGGLCTDGDGIEARQLHSGRLGRAVPRSAERGSARGIHAEEARRRDEVLQQRCGDWHAFRHREMLQRARHGEGGPPAAGPAQSTPSASRLQRRELQRPLIRPGLLKANLA